MKQKRREWQLQNLGQSNRPCRGACHVPRDATSQNPCSCGLHGLLTGHVRSRGKIKYIDYMKEGGDSRNLTPPVTDCRGPPRAKKSSQASSRSLMKIHLVPKGAQACHGLAQFNCFVFKFRRSLCVTVSELPQLLLFSLYDTTTPCLLAHY